MSFNLIAEAWNPVLYADGRFERVGIGKASSAAGGIRRIAASNPMDNVALLRFLLAVLLWCKPNLTDSDRTLLDGADGIPDGWLKNLGTVEDPNDAFNLLGNGKRFYQESASSNERPDGDLLVEFPTDTRIAHFRHVRDMGYGLCPACCALGIVRFCAFANAYASGRYTSAVNGPTPAYGVAQGATLLQTLRLHWPVNGPADREPPWLCNRAPSKDDLDIATVYAWRPRKLWLGDPEEEAGVCAYCGQRANLVRNLSFAGNWKAPFETKGQQKKLWDQDRHLLLVDRGQTAGEEGEGDKSDQHQFATASKKKNHAVKTTLGFPSTGSKVAVHARFWRRVLSAKLTEVGDQGSLPGPILVAGPAANKGLYQDATSLFLRPPLGSAALALDAVDRVVSKLHFLLRRSTPNPDRLHPNRAAALDALSPSIEADLRRDINRPSAGLTSLVDTLRRPLRHAVEKIVRSTTPGWLLRSREAVERAQAALDGVLRDATAPPNEGPSPRNAAKPKHTQKKKGDGP